MILAPFKVGFLTHEPFYPPSGGGSAEAVYLVQELRGRGHEVQVFGPSIRDAATVEERFGVKLHGFRSWEMGRYTRLRNLKYILYPFFLERMILRVGKTANLDVLLSQHAISAVAGGRLKQRLRVPVVMNFLDYLTGFMETWPRYIAPRWGISMLERFELSIPTRYRADGLMTVSDTLADYFVAAGFPEDRIKPIYYGFDADLFPPVPVETILRRGSPGVVVMHGSFDQHHLGAIALDGLRYVCTNRPGTRFRFVGQRTPALETFLSKARGAVPGLQVECTGFVPYAEIAPHLASASVGIVPYEQSTGVHCAFVAKTVEYLATGLPVVSTRLKSGQRYFANEPMIRFSEFNGQSFGEQIVHWLDERPADLLSAGQRAATRVRESLDWRVICARAIDFLEGVVRTTKVGPKRGNGPK